MLQNVEIGLTLRTPQGSRMVGDRPAAMENPNGYGFNLPIAVTGMRCMRTFYGGHKRVAQRGDFGTRGRANRRRLYVLIEPSSGLHRVGIGKMSRSGGK